MNTRLEKKMESLFTIFSELEDPRDNRGKKHLLIHIIILAIYGILCGYEDFTNMAYFLKKKESELTEKLGLLNGIPSHDTFSAVFRIIDPKKFMELFIKWTQSLVDSKNINGDKHIAIDGKAVRAATDKVNNGNIPYVVSAFLTDIGLSIGQYKVDDKSNEIKAVPELLDMLFIEGCTITMDAMGTQKDIVSKIVDKKGHYCLALKENQKTFCNEITEYLDFAIEDNEEKNNISYFETTEKDHGRIETRKYYVSSRTDFITNLKDWQNLSAIGLVIQERTVTGKEKTVERRYYIMDQVLKAEEFARYTRKHWQIENNLHWVLDVIFNEDHSTSKKDNAIINIATVRKMAFNLTKLDPSMSKKTTKKKMIDYTYNFDLFLKLINEIIKQPSTKEL